MTAQSAKFTWSSFFKRLLMIMLFSAPIFAVEALTLWFRAPIAHHPQLMLWALSFMPYVAFAVMMAALWSQTPSRATEARKLYQQVEDRQRFRAFNLLVQTLMLGVVTVLAAHESALSGLSPFAVLLWNCAICLTVGLLIQITGVAYRPAIRPTMDDELTRASRRKALAAGFFALLAAGALAYALGLVLPSLSAYGLPMALFVGIATASVRFALLERAADLAD